MDNEPHTTPNQPAPLPPQPQQTNPPQIYQPYQQSAPINQPMPTYNYQSIQPQPAKRKFVPILVIAVILLAIFGTAATLLMIKFNSSTTQGSSETTVIGTDTKSLESLYDSGHNSGISEFNSDMKDKTISAREELISGFDFKNTEFDSHKQLISLGIASEFASTQSDKDALRAAMYLLYIDDLKNPPADQNDSTFYSKKESDQETVAILKKYEDPSLSAKVQTAITASGIESEVKNNLKLSADDTLEPYSVIAMNFDSISPEQSTFAKEHYMYNATPKMWVELLDQKPYVMLAKNYAQQFTSDPNGSVRSSVIHEFIHAQRAFVVGDHGRNIEERRAELFSGDKSTYFDTKQLFIYTEVFSGINILDMIQEDALNPAAFYTKLYSKLGVATANKLITSRPAAYLSSASNPVKTVEQYTGGTNGFIEDMIQIGSKNQTETDKRIKLRYEKLLGVLKSKSAVVQDVQSNLSGSYAMPAAAKAMTDYINAN